MSKADIITFECQSIRSRVRHLDSVIILGGFARDDTLEVMDLNHAISDMEAVTKEIQSVRDRLVANAQPRLIAAE
jgi:phosphoribosylformylglycinamidine (FGAM) synthase-like amidotransferase family enzyme